MRLFYKVWEKRPEVVKRSGRLLSHIPAEPNYNDKHGHRLVYPTSALSAEFATKYVPVLDAFRVFDDHGPSAARMMSSVDVGGFDALVPLTTPSDLARHIAGGYLHPDDIAFVQAFGRLTESLSENEVVAVGRHEGPEATLDSIIWELRRWRDWIFEAMEGIRAVSSVRNAATAASSAHSLWQAWSFALECIRKAGIDDCGFVSDSTYYKDALLRMSEARDSSCVGLVGLCHLSREVIWRDARIEKTRFAAYLAWTVSTYLGGILRQAHEWGATKLPGVFPSVSDEQVERARRNLRKIYRVESSDVPQRFTIEWLEKQEIEQEFRPPSVSDMASNARSLSELEMRVLRAIRAVVKSHVDPLLD